MLLVVLNIAIINLKFKMNNYHIYEEIGKGKYSTVYKGRKKKSIEYVAVKSLEKSRRQKVLNELRIFHNLNHPNILKFYNWYETRNHLWVILEYCSGSDLLQLIEKDKTLPENVIRSFGIDLIKGLMYMHSKGIIYCDMKPSNVLINEYGGLKYGDFGLSKKIVDLIQTEIKGSHQAKRGTPYYMAPELFQEGGVYSFYSDLWSLGCILYELASGQPPFVSSSFQELVKLILNSELKPLKNYSDEFNELLRGLLTKECNKRVGWKWLVSHPFWQDSIIKERVIPDQPHYKHYLKQFMMSQNENLSYQESKQKEKEQEEIKQQSLRPKKKGVDIIRMSQQIKKNMLRDALSNKYQEDEQDLKSNDVKITRDQEIDMGNEAEDEGQNQEINPEEEIQDEEEEKFIKIDISREKNKTLQRIQKKEFKQKRGQQIENTPVQNTSKLQQQERVFLQTPTNIQSVKLIPIQNLLQHKTDTLVQPIIGNRDVEKASVIRFHAKNLAFKVKNLSDIVKGIETHEIESHFADIYNYLTSETTNLSEKLNALNYFETIIQNSHVANRLVNSAFMNLLLKLLVSVKSLSLRTRVCSIIGQLVRHATVIDNDLAELNISETFVTILKEKNIRLKQKAISSFGEFLFYSATQMDEEQTDTIWRISNSVKQCLIKCLRPGEDMLVKFYACKTIENITAQSILAGKQFTTPDVLQALVKILLNSKNQPVKTSSSIALCHISRLKPVQIKLIMEGVGMKNAIALLKDSTNRIQQSLITLLNAYIINRGQTAHKVLIQEKQLIPIFLDLLDHSSVIVRAKTLLTFSLLLKLNDRWQVILRERKFFQIMDKYARFNHKYILYCLQNLIHCVINLVPKILHEIQQQLQKNIKDQQNQFQKIKSYSQQKDPKTKKENDMESISNIVCSNLFRARIITQPFLNTIFSFLDICENSSQTVNQEFKITMFQIFEAIASDQQIILKNYELFLKTVLPNFLLNIQSQSPDTRFNCIRFFTDILVRLIGEPDIYDAEVENPNQTTIQINNLIEKSLLPNLMKILQDNDPLPHYGLKLLSILVEKNPALVLLLKKINIVNLLFSYFEPNHNRLTPYTMKLLVIIIEQEETNIEEIVSLKLLQRVQQCMSFFWSNEQDWSYGDLLTMLHAILMKIFEYLLTVGIDIPEPMELIDPLVVEQEIPLIEQNIQEFELLTGTLFEMMTFVDEFICEISCRCGLLIMQLIGNSLAEKDQALTQDSLIEIQKSLLSNDLDEKIKGHLCKNLYWIIVIQGEESLVIQEQREILVDVMKKLSQSQDNILNQCALKIIQILKGK